MTLQDILQDFVDVFHTLLSKSCFHGWNAIIGLGHFFVADYFGKIRRKTSTTF